jgi:hypothetical protein
MKRRAAWRSAPKAKGAAVWKPGGDQRRRKDRSEALLKAKGVRINASLPVIESQAEARFRSPREVADRLLALTIAAVKGEGLEQEIVERVVEERRAKPLFSPHELAFIDDPDPSQRDRIQFSWRYEAAWVLLWALRLTEIPLGLPHRICDVGLIAKTVRDSADLARSGLRPAKVLLDEADLIYRCHWAVRQAQLDGVETSGDLQPGVTLERHYALNWLIGYRDGCDWDDVSTDT